MHLPLRRAAIAFAVSAALAATAAPAALAQSATLPLSSLDGGNGFAIAGIEEFDDTGFAVSSAGDINGDGLADAIIGAPEAFNASGATASGRAYVVFGRSGAVAATLPLDSLDGSNGFAFEGENPADYAGHSVSSAGDINGDGMDDLLVGAPANNSPGKTYVVYGRSSGFPARLVAADLDGNAGFVIVGEAQGDRAGRSVSGAGDVNGDGLDDIVIGADRSGNSAGRGYVVFGRTGGFSSPLLLSTLDGNNGFALVGEAQGDFCGHSISDAGDVNGDGVDDLIIGAFGAAHSGSFAGRSYVVFGRTGGFAATLPLANLNGSNGFMLDGETAGDQSGRAVSAAGDINGDGLPDLVIGAHFARPNGTGSGSSYVVFGRSTGFAAALSLASFDGSNGFAINGEGAGDNSGTAVDAAGDINGDGVGDLLIGASGAARNGPFDGRGYIILGKRSGFASSLLLAALNGRNGFAIDSDGGSDQVGTSVAVLGDSNGDGVDDLVIGAPNATANGVATGQAYVLFGSDLVFRNDFETELP